MKGIIRQLFELYDGDMSQESRAAMAAARPVVEEMKRKLALEEFDRLWCAAMDVGSADVEASFYRGVQIGARLMLEVLEHGGEV